jgi:CRISPR/Cas system CMR subunit Cmr4 (Cas7 group RAMP superfamily)
MSVDLQQLQAIHHLQGEVSEADREVKTLVEDYEQQLPDLPEQQAVDEAERALKEARDRLKITIASDSELAELADQIDEAKFKRRDLGEILSHHLVVYHDETGRDVIKDREATTRAIEFKAKLGKPTLDQPRLPLGGPNKYLGQHFPIREGMKVEVKPEEGE